jgi:hypothetical protein
MKLDCSLKGNLDKAIPAFINFFAVLGILLVLFDTERLVMGVLTGIVLIIQLFV